MQRNTYFWHGILLIICGGTLTVLLSKLVAEGIRLRMPDGSTEPAGSVVTAAFVALILLAAANALFGVYLLIHKEKTHPNRSV